MQLKKSVLFSIGDIQEAITVIAKGHGIIARNLTQSELKEIVENGSMSIDMEYIEAKPLSLNNDEMFPFQFFNDMCSRAPHLTVFINNINHTVLNNQLVLVLENSNKDDVSYLANYYKQKTSKLPELGPKAIYGENWRDEFRRLGNLFFSIGQSLLNQLQLEIRKRDRTTIGVKGYKKDSVIEDINDLGFSTRASYPFERIKRDKEQFILGECINKQRIRDFHSWNHVGKKTIKEIEDFILLYDL